VLPFALSISGAFSLIYWQGIFMGSGYIGIKILNPFILMVNRELFRKTEFVNLFQYPVPSYLMALAVAAIWGAAFIIILIITIRKNTVVQKKVRQNAV
jgi:hypothetical protein